MVDEKQPALLFIWFRVIAEIAVTEHYEVLFRRQEEEERSSLANVTEF